MPACPECGGLLPAGRSCQDIFNEFLALEFSDPAYGAVHFLTVSCYMIQHGRYSDAALAWMRDQLRAHLEGGQPVEEIRRAANLTADNARRRWNVLRGPGDGPPPAVDWSLTIAGVDGAQADAAAYRAKVREWAERTLREMITP